MKKYTFPTTVICILLASVLLLAGCMHAVVDDMGTSKEYTAEIVSQTQSDVIGELERPTSQSKMQQKFNVFLHETEDGGVRIFSEGQHHALTQVRENGERKPLTHEEVLYLISDTINLYFQYDKITLTNPRFLQPGDIPQYGSVTPDTVDATYKTYHGIFLEFLSAEDKLTKAYAKYNEMVETIRSIIYYRLYTHDAGIELLTHYIDENGNRHPLQFRSGMPDPHFIALSLDGSSVGGEENTTKLETELGKYLANHLTSDDATSEPLNAPLLLIPLYTMSEMDGTMQIVSTDFAQTQVFPTQELAARAPEKELTLTASLLTEDGKRQTLYLNRQSGTFVIVSNPSYSIDLTGTFTEHNRMLVLYPEDLSGDGTYIYRFYGTGNGLLETYVYNPRTSAPHKDFDFPDGMAFCRDYRSYLNNQAMKKGSGVEYITDAEQYRFSSMTRSVFVKCDDEDADTCSRVYQTVPPYSEMIGTNMISEIKLHIGKGYDGKLTASLPLGAEIEAVTVYTFGAEPTETKTTLAALSDLPDGEYYVAVDLVIAEKYCGVFTTRWVTDFFKLLVKHV